MATGVALPTVLQLLDGTPHRKVASAIFENVPLAKVMQGGNLARLFQQVLADGNLSSVLMNPMAALTHNLQAGVEGFALELNGVSGTAALVSAMTGPAGLSSALSAFRAAGDNLSGLTNGQTGLMALAGHDSLVGMLGEATPPALAASRVIGPVASGDLLAGISAALPGVVQSVIAGSLSVDRATTWVTAQTSAVSGVVADSADALAQGQAAQMLVSAVATISGLTAPVPRTPLSAIQIALGSLVQPRARGAMTAALSAQIQAEMHPRVDIAAMTSLD